MNARAKGSIGAVVIVGLICLGIWAGFTSFSECRDAGLGLMHCLVSSFG